MPNPNYPYPPVKYSILLLTYNRVDLIEARLEECARIFNGRADVAIEILSNGCTDDTGLFLVAEGRNWNSATEKGGLQLTTSGIKENIGFGPGFNMLAKDALGDILFIVSNDVRILGDFITPVAEAIEVFPYSLVCHEMIEGPSGWNQFGGTVINYPAGHFLACTKKLWYEVVGGFDDRYIPNDMEDVDLGMALKQLEIPMVRMESLPIEHMVAGTLGYTPERYENTVLQKKRFAEKWN
ncbi:hypothetical protein LCGC14_1216560, partial [marine sediment metagenome]